MGQITVEAYVNAPRAQVWDCYTNPLHIVNWNFADPSWCCPSASNDIRVGGEFFARMEAKDGSFGFDFQAIYTAVELEHSYTYEFGGRSSTVKFNDNGKGTVVIVSFDPETENPIELQKGGWQAILNNFKRYTEEV